jgi:hypothetical protein
MSAPFNIDQAVLTLVANASRLRAAGITRIRIGDIEADISIAAPPTYDADGMPATKYPEASDPRDDPALYPGGLVPTRRRERHR